MKTLVNYICEKKCFKCKSNNLPYEVYDNKTGKLDKTFTDWATRWTRHPQVGKGWYCGGTIFKVVKIEDNKVYFEY
jgi:hypothetical protein